MLTDLSNEEISEIMDDIKKNTDSLKTIQLLLSQYDVKLNEIVIEFVYKCNIIVL